MTGTTLSHYKIVSELGRGGMGIVYLAEDTKLDRQVAIKVLPPNALTSEDDRARFYREAKAAAALNHPNIAQVYQIDEAVPSDAPHGTQPSPFIAMEYIDGQTVDERIATGPLPLDEAVRITREVADGLQAAHGKNIVHRDIKAANVMLDGQGRAKILDFGLALTAQSTKLTRMGSTLGTVAYMSPEQARGEEVDHRTDIWAVGVLLYELISGLNPFKADYEQAAVYNILNVDPQPLTARRTGVPMGLEFVVDKCLSKDRTARYASAADLIVDLDAVEGLTRRLSTMSSQKGSVYAPRSAPEKKLRPAAWTTAIFALLGAGVLGWWIGNQNPEMNTEIRTLSLQLDDISIVSDIVVGPGDRDAILLVGSGVGTRAAVHWSLVTGQSRTLSRSGLFLFPSISPDGSRGAYVSAFDGTQVLDLEAHTPVGLVEGIWGTALLPNGDLIGVRDNSMVAFNDGIYLRTVGSSSMVHRISPDTAMGHAGLFPLLVSPHGDQAIGHAASPVAGSDENTDVVWVDLERATYDVLVPNARYRGMDSEGFVYWESEAGPDAMTLTAARLDWRSGRLADNRFSLPLPASVTNRHSLVSAEGTLFLYGERTISFDLTWLSSDEIIDTGQSASIEPSISRDGKRVVTVSDTRDHLNVTDLESGTIIRIHEGEYHSQPVWSADDRFVYAAGDRSIESRILRIAADGSGQVDTVQVGTGFAREPNISPDGRQMAYLTTSQYSNNAPWEIWTKDLDTGAERAVVRKPGTFLHNPVWSPDGRFIAYEETFGEGSFGSGQAIRVREVDTQRDWLVSQGTESDRFWDPAWSPDGRTLYFRNPQVLLKRGIRYDPAFGPVGSVEVVRSFSEDFFFAVSPESGDILMRVPDFDADEDEPDLIMIQNWARSWKEEHGIN